MFQTYHKDHLLKGLSDTKLSAVGAIQNSVSHDYAQVTYTYDAIIVHDSNFVRRGKVRRSLVSSFTSSLTNSTLPEGKFWVTISGYKVCSFNKSCCHLSYMSYKAVYWHRVCHCISRIISIVFQPRVLVNSNYSGSVNLTCSYHVYSDGLPVALGRHARGWMWASPPTYFLPPVTVDPQTPWISDWGSCYWRLLGRGSPFPPRTGKFQPSRRALPHIYWYTTRKCSPALAFIKQS